MLISILMCEHKIIWMSNLWLPFTDARRWHVAEVFDINRLIRSIWCHWLAAQHKRIPAITVAAGKCCCRCNERLCIVKSLAASNGRCNTAFTDAWKFELFQLSTHMKLFLASGSPSDAQWSRSSAAALSTVLRRTTLSNGNMRFSGNCPAETPQPIKMRFCRIDNVGEITRCAKNGCNRLAGGGPKIGEI
jgi:hypothetical protein